MAKFINPTKVITGVNGAMLMHGSLSLLTEEHLSIPYLSLFLSQTQRQSRRSRRLFRQRMMKARTSLRVTVSLYLHSQFLRHLFVMVMQRDLMMRLMLILISSMLTAVLHRESQTLIVSLSQTAVRFTAVCMAEQVSTSMLLTATVTRVLPVVLTLFRRLRTVSLLEESPEPRMILILRKMMIFFHNPVTDDNGRAVAKLPPNIRKAR